MPLKTGTGSDAVTEAPLRDLARDVVENVGVLVFRRVMAHDGGVSYPYLNAGAEVLFRRPAAEFRALAAAGEIGSLLHPDDRPAWRAAVARSAGALTPLEFEGRLLWPDGTERWIRATARVRRGQRGETVWDGVAMDVTDQKLVEREHARLASIVEASGDAIYSWAVDGTIISWNAEAERLFGYPAAEAIGRSFLMLVPPDRRPSADAVVAQLVDGGTVRQFETIRLHRDGRRIEVSLTVSPLRDQAGRVVAVSTIARDIGRWRAAEAALRLSEERFRTTLSSIGDGVVATDREARVSFINQVAEELTGWRADEAVGRPLAEVFRAIHEQSRRPVENPVARVFAEGRVVGLSNHTLLVGRDGRETPIADSAAPIRDGAGRVVGAVLVFRDVTDERAQAAQRDLLVRELDHRVKNTLTLVQSIVRQTARGAASGAELAAALDGRLKALASAHSLLVRSGWREAGLEELVRDVLAPYPGAGGPARLEVSGPPVRLATSSIATMAMVLHELGTNAAKYGALSADGGRVSIEWRVSTAGDDSVEITWRENGGPPVHPPERAGFGTRMIERAMVHQLRGAAEIRYEPGGVTCRISLPASAARLEAALGGAL